jgi:hypothetical protein
MIKTPVVSLGSIRRTQPNMCETFSTKYAFLLQEEVSNLIQISGFKSHPRETPGFRISSKRNVFKERERGNQKLNKKTKKVVFFS